MNKGWRESLYEVCVGERKREHGVHGSLLGTYLDGIPLFESVVLLCANFLCLDHLGFLPVRYIHTCAVLYSLSKRGRQLEAKLCCPVLGKPQTQTPSVEQGRARECLSSPCLPSLVRDGATMDRRQRRYV